MHEQNYLSTSEQQNSIFGADVVLSENMIKPDRIDTEKILFKVKKSLEK